MMCRSFGISRKTGYKIFKHYKEREMEALCQPAARAAGATDRAAEKGEAALGRTQDP